MNVWAYRLIRLFVTVKGLYIWNTTQCYQKTSCSIAIALSM